MLKTFIINYWAQFTVIIGLIGYILKTTLDYSLKTKELKYKYFYELKGKKIIELYTKVVEIQMIIDREKKDDCPTFENNVTKNRLQLDKLYWESTFYLGKKSELAFKDFLQWLKFFEVREMIEEDPKIANSFEKATHSLITELKSEMT